MRGRKKSANLIKSTKTSSNVGSKSGGTSGKDTKPVIAPTDKCKK